MSRLLILTALVAAVLVGALAVASPWSDSPSPAPLAADGSEAFTTFSAFRETGDATLLTQADEQVAAALLDDPTDLLALETAARIALFRREFKGALNLADRAAALAPDRAAPAGLRADALLGLGRYDAAFPLIEDGLEGRTDHGAYARASYAAELRGEVERSLELMDLALDVARPGTPARSRARENLIVLNLRYGRLAAAEEAIVAGAAANPDDPQNAVNRARLAAARGDLEAAERSYARAVEDLPAVGHLAALAGIEAALGDDESASARLDSARAALDASALGRDHGLERAILDGDWTIPEAAQVSAARRARARRPNVDGDAALGWVLARAGRCEEAVTFARRSVRLGYRDPLVLFRAAYAEWCAGNAPAAQEIATGLIETAPGFSSRWAPDARLLAAGSAPSLAAEPTGG